MEKTIRLRVLRETEREDEFKVLKLKGSLISNGYTEIIHIADENEQYYLNSFLTASDKSIEAENFVKEYISEHNLGEVVWIA